MIISKKEAVALAVTLFIIVNVWMAILECISELPA